MQSLALLLVPGLPIFAAALIAVVRPAPASAARLAIAATAAATVAAAGVLVGVSAGSPWSSVIEGDDGRAVAGLAADRLSAVLALMTTAVGAVVQSFAARSMEGDRRYRRWFVLAALLTGSTSLVALSATASGLLVGWVATGAALTALVGHYDGWRPARQAVRRTRRTFLVGDVALAAATLVLLATVGDIDLRRTGQATAGLRGERLSVAGWFDLGALPLVAVLFVIAGVCRSAFVPMHRWLPATLAAPTPVSAMLHAGVVNGAGVLLIRTAPVVAESRLAMWLVFLSGAATAVLATSVMLVRADVKGGLAWSTAGQMGFMGVQIAVGAFAAALFHIVGHAMYKAALFLGAGEAISAHGARRHLPVARTHVSRPVRLVIAVVVPAVAMAGALAAFEPHGVTAGIVLIAVFGWMSSAQAVNGWLRSAPASMSMVAIGLGGAVIAPLTYVGGLTLFERFVEGATNAPASAAVSTSSLLVLLVSVAAAGSLVGPASGPLAARLRSRVHGLLVGIGAPPVTPLRSSPPHEPTAALARAALSTNPLVFDHRPAIRGNS